MAVKCSGSRTVAKNFVLFFFGLVAYKDPKLTKLDNAKMTTWVDNIKRFSVENGADDKYFFSLNYAELNQNPLGSYGEKSLGFIKEVANVNVAVWVQLERQEARFPPPLDKQTHQPCMEWSDLTHCFRVLPRMARLE